MATKRQSIVVVDDHPLAARLISSLVMDAAPGCAVFEFTSSVEAVSHMARTPASVLLCDLEMPEMNGIGVLERALDGNPSLVSILVTGNAAVENLTEALNRGRIWRCIEKPWDNSVFVKLVREPLDVNAKRQQRAGAGAKPVRAADPERKRITIRRR